MNDAQSKKRPRPWRLQFSLKLLLLTFTAFAIGFPIWYRWPYEETDSNQSGTVRRITTWQRQWGGGRKKQGWERQIQNGETIESLSYRNGLRHGPYESPQIRGQFVNDIKEGVWTGPDRTMTYRHGKLDGPAEIRLPPEQSAMRRPPRPDQPPPSKEPRVVKLVFADGRLTHFNGQPAANRLFQLRETDDMDQRTSWELGKSTSIDLVQMPLKDTMLYLTETHSMPMVLDAKLGKNLDLPITASYRGIDLCSALLLLTAPNGLACDYRYGCIWITTAEDGNDWHDPTGVTELKPPKGSPLELAWNEVSPAVDCVQMPLTEVLAYLKQPLAIDIGTTQIEQITADSSPPLITASLRGLSFRNTLGQLLYKTHCRCRLEGERLVILPPVEKDPKGN